MILKKKNLKKIKSDTSFRVFYRKKKKKKKKIKKNKKKIKKNSKRWIY